MTWWKFGRSKAEIVEAGWLGEKIADVLDPTAMLETIRDWHNLPSDDTRSFVAVVSLRMTGFGIGTSQKSITNHVGKKELFEVHNGLIGTLVDRSLSNERPNFQPHDLLNRIMELSQALTAIFYAHSSSKPPQPIPHYYVGKELCGYVQNGGVPNPEEVFTFADYLSKSMIATKSLFDELIEANVRIVASKDA